MEESKGCSDCHNTKLFSEFCRHKNTKSGRASICKECQAVRNRVYYENNKEKEKARQRDKYRSDPELARMAVYRSRRKNPEREHQKYLARADKIAESNKRWRKNNPHMARAIRGRRRAAEVNAIPVWADRHKIALIYAEANRLTVETGVPHEVDHIVPLQGKIVCGLHWEGNLQVLPKVENRSKLNRYRPDMPTELRA